LYTALLLAATGCLGWDGGDSYPSYGGYMYGGYDCGCYAQPWGNPYYGAAYGAWYGNPWGPMGGWGGCGCYGYGGYNGGCCRHEGCLRRLCERHRHRRDCDNPYGGYGDCGGNAWGGGYGPGWGSVADAYEASGCCPGGCEEHRHCCLRHLCHRHKHRRGVPPPCFLPCGNPYDGGFDWDDCSDGCTNCNSGGSSGSPQGGGPNLGAPPLAKPATPAPAAGGGDKPK
jgi:hypothetical protein